MEQLRQQLAGHAIIGLDTSVFIRYLEAHPRYQPMHYRWQRPFSTPICSPSPLMLITEPRGSDQPEATTRTVGALHLHNNT